jgi:hypothetical protein
LKLWETEFFPGKALGKALGKETRRYMCMSFLLSVEMYSCPWQLETDASVHKKAVKQLAQMIDGHNKQLHRG